MFNIYEYVQSILSTLERPVYYEDFVDTNAVIPCLSYYVVSDVNSHLGDTQSIDDITIRVTVWSRGGNTEAFPIARGVEEVMNEHGFKRSGVNDLFLDDQLMKKVLSYRCVAREDL